MGNLLNVGRGLVEKYKKPCPYIEDSLILYLDGIEQGDTANAWTDLVNGIVFTKKAGGVTFNSDNVQFGNNNNNALHNTTYYNYVSSTVGTIEVCYRDITTSGSRTVFYSYGDSNQALGFQFYSGNRVLIQVGNGPTKITGVWTAESTGTYSISGARAFQNMINVGFSSAKDYQTRNAQAAIIGCGGRGGSTYYDPLVGKLHSIRIYNRRLTEEEVLFNQRVDNTRFNLGLTIPT